MSFFSLSFYRQIWTNNLGSRNIIKSFKHCVIHKLGTFSVVLFKACIKMINGVLLWVFLHLEIWAYSSVPCLLCLLYFFNWNKITPLFSKCIIFVLIKLFLCLIYVSVLWLPFFGMLVKQTTPFEKWIWPYETSWRIKIYINSQKADATLPLH